MAGLLSLWCGPCVATGRRLSGHGAARVAGPRGRSDRFPHRGESPERVLVRPVRGRVIGGLGSSNLYSWGQRMTGRVAGAQASLVDSAFGTDSWTISHEPGVWDKSRRALDGNGLQSGMTGGLHASP